MIALIRLLSYSLIVTTAVLFQSFSANAQATDAKTKGSGSISGRVTVDGKGAAGIPVAAVQGQNVNRRDAPGRALSDVEGNYRITGLPQGEYQVWTLTPDLIAAPAAYPNYFHYAGAAKSIILGADENVTGVDLKLIHGSVITGRVTTSDNKPVVEERVTLQLLDANGNPRFGAIGSTYDQMFQTDDRGVYRIFDLAPGRYKVSVGYDPVNDGILGRSHLRKTFYLDPNDQSKPGIVELQQGDEAKNIDVRVEPPTPTYKISGHVIDAETRLPIAKAGVGFMMVRKDQGQGAAIPGFSMQADERGEFSYSGFAAGHYAVSASSGSYGGNFYGDPVEFDVTDKDVTDIELKTVPGLSVSGFITAPALSSNELMKLLPGLVVSASGISQPNQLRISGRAVVMPDGSFQVAGLRPGPVSIFASTQRPSFIRTTISRIERDGVEVKQGFDLQQSISDLRIMIDYGTGSIRGTVRIETDTPITDSLMYIRCNREGARDGNSAQVDSRGHFEIKNLAPGPYEMTLQVNGLTPRPPRGIPPQKQIVNIANDAETEVIFTINLKQGGQ